MVKKGSIALEYKHILFTHLMKIPDTFSQNKGGETRTL